MINYPAQFDTEHTLYAVRDMLQATLAVDYRPGDSAVTVEENIDNFPQSGIITLIDQAAEDKAISLIYKRHDNKSFYDLEVAEESLDLFRARKQTKVVMQIRAEHHNAIVDAVQAIEGFMGTKRDESQEPYQGSLFGRLNFLRKLLYTPKAWFAADIATGLVPMTVTFTSQSHGVTGPVGEVVYYWNFGDGNESITDTPIAVHTYRIPGTYDVSLKVKNGFGENELVLTQLINARVEAPREAIIEFDAQTGQIVTPGSPPTIRTPANQPIILGINQENTDPYYSNAGELLEDGKPLDPIKSFSWVLGDTLSHSNASSTKALFALGGVYDLTLRVDTALGAYRITNYDNCIDVVEPMNLWLWTFTGKKQVQANEMGIYTETFKTTASNKLSINTNDSFLKTEQEKREFNRNAVFTPRNNGMSGMWGTGLLLWASGRGPGESSFNEEIMMSEYNGFTDTYSGGETLYRPWNWVALTGDKELYIILGNVEKSPPTMSLTNNNKTTIDLSTMYTNSQDNDGYTYINGAQELQYNPGEYDSLGKSIHGHYSIYRSTWRGYTGYILRNDESFALRNFYKTSGNIGMPFMSLVKLIDVPGNPRKEGQIVALNNGVYLFDNTGSVMVYHENTSSWETTGAISAFAALRDHRIPNADGLQSMLAASDGRQSAYLSFDYSPSAFCKFNEIDLSFHTLGNRPSGQQWTMNTF